MSLIQAIHLGLRRGYYQYKQFGDSVEGFENKMTEYLLTVFVAIEIYNIPGGAKQIKVEYPLWEFYMKAFPRIRYTSKEDLFNQSEYIKSEYQKTRTKQRIDIALMEMDPDNNLRSKHGIELKAINTNYNDEVKDLERLSGAMITTDRSDTNSIESCYSGFIKSYKSDNAPITSNELRTLKEAKLSEIESRVLELLRTNPRYQTLEYNVHSLNIDSVSAEQYLNSYSGQPDSQPDYSDGVENTGEVLGVVIEIKRK
jgi:hypothetical protein